MEPLEDPIRLTFEQAGRRKPGGRLPKVFSLSQRGCAEFPRPCKDVLENVFVNGLQVRGVIPARNWILQEFICAGSGMEGFEGR